MGNFPDNTVDGTHISPGFESSCLDNNENWCQKFKWNCKAHESLRRNCKKSCGTCKMSSRTITGNYKFIFSFSKL